MGSCAALNKSSKRLICREVQSQSRSGAWPKPGGAKEDTLSLPQPWSLPLGRISKLMSLDTGDGRAEIFPKAPTAHYRFSCVWVPFFGLLNFDKADIENRI